MTEILRWKNFVPNVLDTVVLPKVGRDNADVAVRKVMNLVDLVLPKVGRDNAETAVRKVMTSVSLGLPKADRDNAETAVAAKDRHRKNSSRN